jgi:thiol:disulfide interchange protein
MRQKLVKNMKKINKKILGIVILLPATIIIAGVIQPIWGIYELTGLCFLIIAGYAAIIKKETKIFSLRSPFIWCLAIGITLLILSFMIGENYYIDFSSLFPSFSTINTGPASINSPPGGYPA